MKWVYDAGKFIPSQAGASLLILDNTHVGFEPSSLQIKVNEVTNVMRQAPSSLPLLIQTNAYRACVMGFGLVFFRGHLFILSFISSLEAMAKAVFDHELLSGAFLLMVVAVHMSLL